MTGAQLHRLVAHFEGAMYFLLRAGDERMVGNIARGRRFENAARRLELHAHHDLGRFMSHAQYLEFGAARDAREKRNRRAAETRSRLTPKRSAA